MTSLDVFLQGTKCGVLTQSSSGNLSFSYEEDYGLDQTPISLSMQQSVRRYPKSKILPFLEGLLPDNESALRALAGAHGISANNPFALISVIGADVAGALQFLSPDSSKKPSEHSKHLSDVEIERYLQQKIGEYSTGIPGVSTGFFSLAGAQPKLALRKEGHEWFVGTSSKPTTHIIKPLTAQLPDVDLAELLTMETARQLGLNVAEAEFYQFGGTRSLVVTRYDRKLQRGRITRIHQEDFLQSLGISPKNKYQKLEGGPGLKRIASLFKSIRPPWRHQVAAEFFNALVFNVLVRATDAHAKNYSFLLDGTSVRLAPLYDLISGAYFSVPKESAMAVEGEYRFSAISAQMLAREGERLGVENSLERVEGITEALPDAITEAKSKLQMQLPRSLVTKVKGMADTMLRVL